MKKLKVLLIGLVATITMATGLNVSAYTVNNEFNLSANQGSSVRANNNYIILHETANPRATGRNEATYMKNNWFNAYTAYIVGDGGIVYKVGEPGYVQYGAGSYANANSPVQIELQHTLDKELFKKNYRAYVELARASADQFGIPKTLDTPYNQRGIKSHLWVTQNIWGDHSDPYGYLEKMGVSKAQLAHDIANGFNANPKPVSPSQANHDNAVTQSPAVYNDGQVGKLDVFKEQPSNKIRVAGWNIYNYNYGYVFLIDANTGKEVARQMTGSVARPDVAKAYNIKGGNKYGMDVTFDKAKLKGHKVYPMFRRTNDKAGNLNGGGKDVHLKDIYLTF